MPAETADARATSTTEAGGRALPPAPVGPPRRPSAAGNAGLLCTYVLFAGLTPIAAKDALNEMPPIATGVLRFAISAVLLVATRFVWQDADPRARRRIAWADYRRFLLAALLCVPVNQFCFLKGTQLSNASHAGLFYALNPVLVYLLTLAAGYVRWSRRMGTAAVLAFAGAAAIGWEGYALGRDEQFLVGDLLLLGAVASWAAYSVIVLPLTQRYGGLRSATVVIVLGVLLYAPGLLVDGDRLDFAALSWRALGGFLFIAVITSYLNYMLWFIALTRMDINRLSIAANASPIVAVVGAHFWLHDPLTRWLVVGGTLILAAITLANWDKLRRLRRSA